jgi:guanosine-3',5'-bis(diphosphate) 3'-pyrophosphohydrolase
MYSMAAFLCAFASLRELRNINMMPIEKSHEQLLQAVALCARAHHGQMRKDQKTPYASHPFRVCLIVREIFGFSDPRMLLAAVLHDTIEDTTTDFDDLEAKFGREVATWVSLLSKDKRLPEAEREEAYCRGLEQAPWQVKACKLADMFDNLMDMDMLPAERRPHTLGRMRMYLGRLETKTPELQKPWNLVRQLLQDREGLITV